MGGEGYCGWVCVCVSVCLSVKSHLTSGAPEINTTYATGNEGQNICGIFTETASLRISRTPSVIQPYVQAAIFHGRVLYLWACAYQIIRAYRLICSYAHTSSHVPRVCTLVFWMNNETSFKVCQWQWDLRAMKATMTVAEEGKKLSTAGYNVAPIHVQILALTFHLVRQWMHSKKDFVVSKRICKGFNNFVWASFSMANIKAGFAKYT